MKINNLFGHKKNADFHQPPLPPLSIIVPPITLAPRSFCFSYLGFICLWRCFISVFLFCICTQTKLTWCSATTTTTATTQERKVKLRKKKKKVKHIPIFCTRIARRMPINLCGDSLWAQKTTTTNNLLCSKAEEGGKQATKQQQRNKKIQKWRKEIAKEKFQLNKFSRGTERQEKEVHKQFFCAVIVVVGFKVVRHKK